MSRPERRFIPTLPLRAWLVVAYTLVLVLPALALWVSGALGADLVRQTRWDLEHQAAIWAVHVESVADGRPVASVADALSSEFRRAKARTLSGIRMVDADGLVIASSGDAVQLGLDLSENREVSAALSGRVASLTRPRKPAKVPLSSAGRRAAVRVFVAQPVRVDDAIVGAVVLSRTPREELQAVYQMAPAGLWQSALAAFLVVLVFSVVSSLILTRSLKSVAAAATTIAAGRFEGRSALAAPKASHLREVGATAHAVEQMALRLEERLAYISEFASNVSHEFKTPLATLRGTVELLMDDDDMPAEQRERFLNNASGSVERLQRLVDGLLSLARAEEDPVREPVEVQDMLASITQSVSCPLDGTTTAMVLGNRAQLESVFRNLLENARVHGGEASVAVREAQGMVVVDVVDDGDGISAANQTRIFERFFTTGRETGSSGLGLALVRAILFTHGGAIGVESVPGRTCFTVRLPLESS